MRRSVAVLALTCLALSARASAGGVTYDFAPVTALAQGATQGQGVSTPVQGFELLLMKDGQVVYHRAFGSWTIGRVAAADSATKTLSGALVMSVLESSAGAYSLDTRLSQIIPAFTGNKANITLRHAFAHTSGLGGAAAVSSATITLQQAALQIAAAPVSFTPPGSRFQYGGSSMHAAGAVIETIGGQPWNTLFAQRITGPVGMPSTTFVLTTPANPRIAGGCESTGIEFARFMEMLRRGGVTLEGTRVLSAASVQQIFTRQTAPGIPINSTPIVSPYTDGADYGVGVWLDERDASGNLLGALAAGARGFSAWVDFDDGLVGVFATDLTFSGNVQPLLYQIRAAAQTAVRTPVCALAPCNRADITAIGGGPCPDGQLTVDDVIVFVNLFSDGTGCPGAPGVPCSASDVTDIGDTAAGPDGQLTVDDIIAFVNAFSNGCP